MATDSRSLLSYLSNDADFRSWGSGIAAQLAAVGLTQTSDTGQINWTTVARPAAGSAAGYEIWRFSDSLQTTRPVYIKMEYGTQFAQDRPSLWVTIGSGTNGAGTLTGTTSSRLQANTQVSTSSSSTATSYCSGANNRLSLLTNYIANGYMCIIIERIKAADGTANGDATALYAKGQSTGTQIVPFTGTATTSTGGPPSLFDTTNLYGFTVWGSDTALFPFVYVLGKMYWGNNLLYKSGDFTTGVSISVQHLGATRTFMPLGANAGQYHSTLTSYLALIWE